MIPSSDSLDYIGYELELFIDATNWKKYFSEKISPYVRGDVMEVGAGMGINTQYLANTPNTITSWCLVEPDAKLASQIENITMNVPLPNKTIVNGTIKSIEDLKFDTII